ncbi:GntR family transcriptional regulator [Gephyromycinifex aptenodytis]|uniref:GntR family transcriptional regulator n=1 Tax=Gephyromycinifex aptenodytis TaxID=2716227 RepID=UPI001446A009|nr:GntR family transcriptional regulator [Gephyromycinifex aptenodytis]
MDPSLDPQLPKPMYLQVAALIADRITAGELPTHHRLPAEPELARDLGIARGTLRKALSELISQGLLVRVHGRGTFVAPARFDAPLSTDLVTIAEDLTTSGVAFSTTVVSQRIMTAPTRVARRLRRDDDVAALELIRVRSDVDGPIAYLVNYVPASTPETQHLLEAADFTRHTLFGFLESRLHQVVDHGERAITAAAAPRDIAQHLGLPTGSPVTHMEQVSYNDRDVPVECSTVWISPQRMRVHARVTRQRL